MSILRSMVALWFGGLSGCAGAQIELVDVRSRHADETTFAVACAKFEAIENLGELGDRHDGLLRVSKKGGLWFQIASNA